MSKSHQFNINLKRISRLYPGSKALVRRLYIHQTDKELIVKVADIGKKRKLIVSPSEVLEVHGKRVCSDQELIRFPGVYDYYTQMLLVASWAIDNCQWSDPVKYPGYIVGYKDSYMDVILRTLRLPRWKKIQFYCYPAMKDVDPKQFFKHVDPNPSVRAITRLAAQAVGIPRDYYDLWVGGSYISTTPSIGGMVKLVAKLSTPTVTWSVDQRIAKIALHYVQSDIFREYEPAIFKWDKKFIDTIAYNGNSGVGFPYKPGLTGVKKWQCAEDVKERLYNMCILLSEGYSIYELVQPAMSKILFKPEVRDHTAEVGKARAIGQCDMLTDFIADMIGRPYMDQISKCKWYCSGWSYYTSMISNLLYAIGHPAYSCYHPIYKNLRFKERDDDVWCYLMGDFSCQDGSFTAETQKLLHDNRIGFWNFKEMSEADKKVFLNLALYTDLIVKYKNVQWFNGEYFIQNCISTSGDKLTATKSGAKCYLDLVTILCILLHRFFENTKWWLLLNDFHIVACGDNFLIVLRRKYIPMFCEIDWSGEDVMVPKLFVETAKLIGGTIKMSETKLLMPTPTHSDRFFSTIVNDEVIQEGITFIQRKFVKIDQDNNLLPQNSPTWYKLGMWRETSAYLVKSANHEFDWNHPSGDIFVAMFQKYLGLMFDAAYNRTAHNYLRECMRIIERKFPGMAEWSTSALDLAELRIKVPVQKENILRKCMAENSFDFVTSKMSVSVQSTSVRYNI